MKNTALVMIGSNLDAESNISLAIQHLSDIFTVEKMSSCLSSKPVGDKYKSPFHNKAIRIISNLDYENTIISFKEIERKLGRTPESKQSGLVTMDIDLIFWNGEQVHRDYDRFPFVKKCIDQLND